MVSSGNSWSKKEALDNLGKSGLALSPWMHCASAWRKGSEIPVAPLATLQQHGLNMVNHKIGQEWPCAKEIISFLCKEVKTRADFPDPLALYSLYRVVIDKEPLTQWAEYPSLTSIPSAPPFRGRDEELGLLRRYGSGGGRRTYGFWINTLYHFQ